MSSQRPRPPLPRLRPPAPAPLLPLRVAHFEVRKNLAGNWFWDLHAANGQIIATAGEHFATKANAERAAQSVKAIAPSAPIKITE